MSRARLALNMTLASVGVIVGTLAWMAFLIGTVKIVWVLL